MTISELAEALRKLGCPADQSEAMAAQLDRKARMDAERRNISYDVARDHLLQLMAQGWASRRP